MSGVSDEVRAACDQMVEAERMKDLDAVRELIWEDAVWLPPNADPVEGIDDIMALFAEFFDVMAFTDLAVTRIEWSDSDSGDLASCWGTFELVVESSAGEVTLPFSFLMSWEKRDGAWKAAANMYTSTAPPESG